MFLLIKNEPCRSTHCKGSCSETSFPLFIFDIIFLFKRSRPRKISGIKIQPKFSKKVGNSGPKKKSGIEFPKKMRRRRFRLKPFFADIGLKSTQASSFFPFELNQILNSDLAFRVRQPSQTCFSSSIASDLLIGSLSSNKMKSCHSNASSHCGSARCIQHWIY